MDKSEIIERAIESKSMLSFWYEGGERIVEPFLLGRHMTTGNISLRAWWVRGFSRSNKTNPNWRLFKINLMSDVKILDESYSGIREFYNPNDKHMEQVYCRI